MRIFVHFTERNGDSMSKVYVLLADGFEEVEGLTVVDLLRRAGVEVRTVSIKQDVSVMGSHKINVIADTTLDYIHGDADMVVLPGGLTGTNNLKNSAEVDELIRRFDKEGKYLAAVCAAPTVYGEKGLLKGKKATCYPGMEDGLVGAEWTEDSVAVDGNYITSRGLGTSIDFALKLVELLVSKDKADEIAHKIVYR